MKRKSVSIMLALVMVAGLAAGCGGGGNDSNSASDANSASTSVSTSADADSTSSSSGGEDASGGDATVAELPEVPDLGGLTSNEWLLEQEDRIPLAGVVTNHLESRADVYKALDKVDLEDDDVQIAFLAASQGTQFFTTMTSSFQERCDEYGYHVTFFDANFDLGTQQQQYENVLSGDYDWIVCNATDIHALADLYRQSVEAGIPVIVTGPSSAEDEYPILTTILSGSWASGYQVGMYTAEHCWGQYDEALKVGCVISKVGDADSESRPNGFMAGYLYKYAELAGQPYESQWDAAVIAYNAWKELRDNGSVEIPGILNMVGYVTTDNIATSAAQPACAELLTAHPDMDIAFVETDSFGLAMVTECYQNGIQPGEDMLIVYAADGTGDLCQAVKDGDVLCIGTNVPYYNGYGCADLIHDVYEGFDANDMPANSYTPTYAVTAENVDEVWSEGQPYADALDFELQTTEEYNEANAES